MFQNPRNHPQLKAAVVELNGITEMFEKMTDLCFRKCMHKFPEPDLNIGEMSCSDRCVGKYLETYEKVGVKLQEFQVKQQQLAQQGGPGM